MAGAATGAGVLTLRAGADGLAAGRAGAVATAVWLGRGSLRGGGVDWAMADEGLAGTGLAIVGAGLLGVGALGWAGVGTARGIGWGNAGATGNGWAAGVRLTN